MYKTALNIGTLAGIGAFVLFLLLYYIGLSPLSFGKFIGFWIPIAAIFYVNLKVRKEILGGNMTYAQGFLNGVVTVFTWCSLKGFCMYIFMTLIDHNVIDQYMQFTEGYIQFVEKITGESLQNEVNMEELAAQLTPWNVMLGDININAMYGIFLTFIIAFITKRVPARKT